MHRACGKRLMALPAPAYVPDFVCRVFSIHLLAPWQPRCRVRVATKRVEEVEELEVYHPSSFSWRHWPAAAGCTTTRQAAS